MADVKPVLSGLCIGLAWLLVSWPAAAAERALVLDVETTTISINLGATLHTVRGSFRLLGGEVLFDEQRGTASGWIRVDAGSGETGNRARDRKMHQQVLESDRYPEIVFDPKRLELGSEGEDGRELMLEGNITIHGSQYPLTIPARVREGPGGGVTIHSRFVVPYVSWGMRDVSSFFSRVAPEVEVVIEGQGVFEERR
jgi:polyisoprenoid-binding protein YceI